MRRLLGASLVVLLLFIVGAAQERKEVALQGERVFRIQGCHGCHTIGRMGTPIGPDLSRVGSRYSEAYLTQWLRDPQAQRPNAHMPRLELSPTDVEALAAFLASRR